MSTRARLKHVRRQYDRVPAVWLWTYLLVGGHSRRSSYADGARALFGAAEDVYNALATGDRPVDRYVGWVASQLNAHLKETVRTIRRTWVPKFRVDDLLDQDGLFLGSGWFEWVGRFATEVGATASQPSDAEIDFGLLHLGDKHWGTDPRRLDGARGIARLDKPDRDALLAYLAGTDTLDLGRLGGWVARYENLVRNLDDVVDWGEQTGADIGSMTVEQAVLGARDWHDELRRLRGDGVAIRGEQLGTWPGGWTLENLVTRRQLESEGDAMGHCVGGYWKRVRNGQIEVWSVRSDDGRSRATLEIGVPTPDHEGYVGPDVVLQAKGIGNEVIDAEACPWVVRALDHVGIPRHRWGEAIGCASPSEVVQTWRSGRDLLNFARVDPGYAAHAVHHAITRLTHWSSEPIVTEAWVNEDEEDLLVTLSVGADPLLEWARVQVIADMLDSLDLAERFWAMGEALSDPLLEEDETEMLRELALHLAEVDLSAPPERRQAVRTHRYTLPDLDDDSPEAVQGFVEDVDGLVDEIIRDRLRFSGWLQKLLGDPNPRSPRHRRAYTEAVARMETFG